MARIQNPFDNQEVQLEENEELVSIDEVVSKPLEQDLQSNDEVTSTATEEPTKISLWKMLLGCTKKLRSY